MLNINQTKAVMTNDRFVFLLAGAGTGKTRVIVERIKRLIKEGLNPKEILVISFTRKSVYDLKTKLRDYPLFITSYHGLCYYYFKSFINIEIVDAPTLINAGFTKDQLRMIEVNKRNGKYNYLTKKYNKYLKKYNLFDFTDLELVFIDKLKKDVTFRKQILDKYTYIFIDEFQDTSFSQFTLLQSLVSFKTFIFCVGDPNQAIYSFRGASKKVIESYVVTYNAKIHYLDLNYRSNKHIINAANNVIRFNKSFFKNKLYYVKKEGGNLQVNCFNSIQEQINFINQQVRQYLKTFKQNQIAIIYRNHFLAVELKQYFYKTYYEEINFLTIHQAKGLEFDIVFFIGLEEGHLPMKNIDIKEERNLFYVGITRAKQILHLCSCIKNKKPSRFIKECF